MPSISISKGKGNFKHNTRTQEKHPINVDSGRTHLNQVLINKDIRDVYHEIFDSEVEIYNKSQVSKGHSERQIDDYYKKILNDKKTKPFHELVIQVGNKDDELPIETTNAIYKQFLIKFMDKNPNLVVVGAYIHNDESTSHMHLDYVPIATYARGLKKRVANDRAIKEIGYKSWDAWREVQMETLEKVLHKHGLEREIMFNDNRHIADVNKFKSQAQAIERMAKAELEKIKVPEPEIRTNPFTKKQTVTMTLDEYNDLIKNYELDKTSYEAHKSVLTAEIKKSEQKLDKFKNKPYVLKNKSLERENKKLVELIDSMSEENKNLKANTVNLTERNKKLAKESEVLRIENSNLNNEIDKLEGQLDFTQSEYRILESSSSVTELKQLKAENRHLSSLPGQVQELQKENENLKQKYSDELNRAESWKIRFEEVSSKLEQVREELQKKISFLENNVDQLKEKIKHIAVGNNAIRATIGYVKTFFSDGTGQSILEGAEKAIVQYAREDGISEHMSTDYCLSKATLKNMPDIGYTFKNGKEGKGIYDKNNEMILEVSSLKEARELMPDVRIKDGRNRGLER